MADDSAETLFENMLEHLKQVASDLKLLELAGWPLAANGAKASGDAEMEAMKAAARSVAVIAAEVARDALQLCSRLEESGNTSGGPFGPGRRKRPSKKQIM
jgi:hypothetical protein